METRTPARAVNYPSAAMKKKYKEKVLKENPDTLLADFISTDGKSVKNNLIFQTNPAHTQAWKSALCEHYKHIVNHRGIGHGGRFTVWADKSLDTDNAILTVSYYPTQGKFLLQGNDVSL